MPAQLQPDRWYLFSVKKLRHVPGAKAKVDVLFESAQGDTVGQPFVETFYLTEKAISRFEVLCHRAGREADVKTIEDAKKVGETELTGKKVWALLVGDEQYGVLRISGWNMRPETEPPEEESFIDYRAEDELERACGGW